MADVPISKSRPGPLNPHWKGGQSHDGNGRIYLYRPDHPDASIWGYVYRYRLVMEQKLGRPLREDEVVHHKDGNPSNDAPDNLEVITQSEHIEKHRDELLRGRKETAGRAPRLVASTDFVRWMKNFIRKRPTPPTQDEWDMIAEHLASTFETANPRTLHTGDTTS